MFYRILMLLAVKLLCAYCEDPEITSITTTTAYSGQFIYNSGSISCSFECSGDGIRSLGFGSGDCATLLATQVFTISSQQVDAMSLENLNTGTYIPCFTNNGSTFIPQTAGTSVNLVLKDSPDTIENVNVTSAFSGDAIHGALGFFCSLYDCTGDGTHRRIALSKDACEIGPIVGDTLLNPAETAVTTMDLSAANAGKYRLCYSTIFSPSFPANWTTQTNAPNITVLDSADTVTAINVSAAFSGVSSLAVALTCPYYNCAGDTSRLISFASTGNCASGPNIGSAIINTGFSEVTMDLSAISLGTYDLCYSSYPVIQTTQIGVTLNVTDSPQTIQSISPSSYTSGSSSNTITLVCNFNCAADGGNRWIALTQTSNCSSVTAAEKIVSAGVYVNMTFTELFAGSYNICYSSDGASTWTYQTLVTNFALTDSSSTIVNAEPTLLDVAGQFSPVGGLLLTCSVECANYGIPARKIGLSSDSCATIITQTFTGVESSTSLSWDFSNVNAGTYELCYTSNTDWIPQSFYIQVTDPSGVAPTVNSIDIVDPTLWSGQYEVSMTLTCSLYNCVGDSIRSVAVSSDCSIANLTTSLIESGTTNVTVSTTHVNGGSVTLCFSSGGNTWTDQLISWTVSTSPETIEEFNDTATELDVLGPLSLTCSVYDCTGDGVRQIAWSFDNCSTLYGATTINIGLNIVPAIDISSFPDTVYSPCYSTDSGATWTRQTLATLNVSACTESFTIAGVASLNGGSYDSNIILPDLYGSHQLAFKGFGFPDSLRVTIPDLSKNIMVVSSNSSFIITNISLDSGSNLKIFVFKDCFNPSGVNISAAVPILSHINGSVSFGNGSAYVLLNGANLSSKIHAITVIRAEDPFSYSTSQVSWIDSTQVSFVIDSGVPFVPVAGVGTNQVVITLRRSDNITVTYATNLGELPLVSCGSPNSTIGSNFTASCSGLDVGKSCLLSCSQEYVGSPSVTYINCTSESQWMENGLFSLSSLTGCSLPNYAGLDFVSSLEWNGLSTSLGNPLSFTESDWNVLSNVSLTFNFRISNSESSADLFALIDTTSEGAESCSSANGVSINGAKSGTVVAATSVSISQGSSYYLCYNLGGNSDYIRQTAVGSANPWIVVSVPSNFVSQMNGSSSLISATLAELVSQQTITLTTTASPSSQDSVYFSPSSNCPSGLNLGIQISSVVVGILGVAIDIREHTYLKPNTQYILCYNAEGLTGLIKQTGAVPWLNLTTSTLYMNSAVFSGSVASIVVTFSADVDQGLDLSCSQLLTTASITGLDVTDSNCIWSSTKTLTLYLGNSFTVTPASSITFLPNVIASGSSNLSPLTVDISAPSTGIPAVNIVLAAPREVGSCSSIRVSAALSQGSAGRELSYSWSLVELYYASNGTTFSNPAFAQAISGQYNASWTLSAEEMNAFSFSDSIQFTIRALVTNWLGSSASAIVNITRFDYALQLAAVIDVSIQEMYASDVLELESEVEACSSTNTFVPVILWRIESTATVSYAYDNSSSTLYLPEYTLSPGYGYIFHLRMNAKGSFLYSETSATVSVIVEPLKASIIYVEADSTFTISTGLSSNFELYPEWSTIDPNVQDSSSLASSFVYTWSCELVDSSSSITNTSLCLTNQAAMSDYVGSTGIVSIPRSILYLTGTSTLSLLWSFTVEATHNYQGTTPASATTSFSVQTDASSLISTNSILVRQVQPTSLGTFSSTGVYFVNSRYSSDRNLRLLSQVTLTSSQLSSLGLANNNELKQYLSYEWSCDRIDVTNSSNTLSTTNTNKNLIVRPRALTIGSTYVFSLHVTLSHPFTGAIVSTSTVTRSVTMNSPPTSGTCSVSPSSGTSCSTPFTLACSGWTDDSTDFPLYYGWYYKRSSIATSGDIYSGLEPIRPTKRAASVTAILSQSNSAIDISAASETRTLVVIIQDRFGSITFFETSVTLLATPTLDASSINSLLASAVTPYATSTGYVAKICAGVTCVGSGIRTSSISTSEEQSIRSTLFNEVKSGVVNDPSALSSETGASAVINMLNIIAEDPDVISESDWTNMLELTRDAVKTQASLGASAAESALQVATSVRLNVESQQNLNTTSQLSVDTKLEALIQSVAIDQLTQIESGQDGVTLSASSTSAQTSSTDTSELLLLRFGTEQATQTSGSITLSDQTFSYNLPLNIVNYVNTTTDVSAVYFVTSQPLYSLATTNGYTTDQNLQYLSEAASLTLYDIDDTVINITNLASPIQFDFAHAAALSDYDVLCRFFDDITQVWSTDGCSTASTVSSGNGAYITTCECDHLTLFNVAQFVPSFNTIDITDTSDLTWENLSNYPGPLISLSVLWFLYIIVCLPIRTIDAKRMAEDIDGVISKLKQDPTKQANVTKQANLFRAVTRYHTAQHQHVHRTITDPNRPFWEVYKVYLKERHLLLSVLYGTETMRTITSLQRATLLFVVLITQMTATALFFGTYALNNTERFGVVFFTAAFILPIRVLNFQWMQIVGKMTFVILVRQVLSALTVEDQGDLERVQTAASSAQTMDETANSPYLPSPQVKAPKISPKVHLVPLLKQAQVVSPRESEKQFESAHVETPNTQHDQGDKGNTFEEKTASSLLPDKKDSSSLVSSPPIGHPSVVPETKQVQQDAPDLIRNLSINSAARQVNNSMWLRFSTDGIKQDNDVFATPDNEIRNLSCTTETPATEFPGPLEALDPIPPSPRSLPPIESPLRPFPSPSPPPSPPPPATSTDSAPAPPSKQSTNDNLTTPIIHTDDRSLHKDTKQPFSAPSVPQPTAKISPYVGPKLASPGQEDWDDETTARIIAARWGGNAVGPGPNTAGNCCQHDCCCGPFCRGPHGCCRYGRCCDMQPRRWMHLKWICYALCLCYLIFCSWLILLYGLSFDLHLEDGNNWASDINVDTSVIWLVSSVGSFFQALLINEPVLLLTQAYLARAEIDCSCNACQGCFNC